MHIDIKKNLYDLCQFLLSNNFFFKLKIDYISQNNLLTILNFHRINPNNKIHNSISPNDFNKLIIFLKSKFNIICFKNLINDKKFYDKPPLIISFDDAYEDFFNYASEIIYKNNIKVNQNIIPSCILNKTAPINVQFQDLYHSGILTNEDYKEIKNLFSLKKIDLTRITNSIKNLPIIKQKELLNIFSNKFNFLKESMKTKMMDLSQIKSLNDICELGLHSYEHATMTKESLEYFKDDVLKALKFFSNNYLDKPKIYAFPNGKYTNDQIKYLKSKDFKFILLIENNFNKFDNSGVFYRFPVLGNSYQKNIYTSLGALKF